MLKGFREFFPQSNQGSEDKGITFIEHTLKPTELMWFVILSYINKTVLTSWPFFSCPLTPGQWPLTTSQWIQFLCRSDVHWDSRQDFNIQTCWIVSVRHWDISSHVGGEKYDLFPTLTNCLLYIKTDCMWENRTWPCVLQKYSACASCLWTQTYIKRGLVISVTAFTVVHFVAMPLFHSLKPSVQ